MSFGRLNNGKPAVAIAGCRLFVCSRLAANNQTSAASQANASELDEMMNAMSGICQILRQ